jgi:hypothetical protein
VCFDQNQQLLTFLQKNMPFHAGAGGLLIALFLDLYQ